jgi:type IV pilus assembly protein PilZ
VAFRGFTRVPLRATLLFTPRAEADFVEALGRDISLGGMFVETPTPADFGAELVVHIRLPGSGVESQIDARVRWKTRDGMGLQFGSLRAQETHLITELVRQNQEPPNSGPFWRYQDTPNATSFPREG